MPTYNPNKPREAYTATAGQVTFPFKFKIYVQSDLRVFVGEDTELIEGIDFTATIDGDNGGVVTLLVTVNDGDVITIYRRLPIDRYIEYQTSGDLLANTLNYDQNYQTYLIADGLDNIDLIANGGAGQPNTYVQKSGDYMTGNLKVPSITIDGNMTDTQGNTVTVKEITDFLKAGGIVNGGDANQQWTMFPDGTAIFERTSTTVTTTNTAFGGLYYADHGGMNIGIPGIVWAEPPRVWFSISDRKPAASSPWATRNPGIQTTLTQAFPRMMAPVAGAYGQITAHAVGRWV